MADDDDNPFGGPEPTPREECGKLVHHPTHGSGSCEWPKGHNDRGGSPCDPNPWENVNEDDFPGDWWVNLEPPDQEGVFHVPRNGHIRFGECRRAVSEGDTVAVRGGRVLVNGEPVP